MDRTEVTCRKLFRSRYNPRGDTKFYFKRMTDPSPTVGERLRIKGKTSRTCVTGMNFYTFQNHFFVIVFFVNIV